MSAIGSWGIIVNAGIVGSGVDSETNIEGHPFKAQGDLKLKSHF